MIEITHHVDEIAGIAAGADLPEWPFKMPPPTDTVVLVSGQMIAFGCPCESGIVAALSLDPNDEEHWTVVTESPLTITPSVNSSQDWCQRGDSCHYFIINGEVVWA